MVRVFMYRLFKITNIPYIRLSISLFFFLSVWGAPLISSGPQGKVMILEYHKIDYPESRWTRTPENFRNDLQRFCEKGYQLIRLGDFLENRIRVGKGKTPLI